MTFELQRGSRVGNYELLVRIGRGGMASVWVARGRPTPTSPERLVAVKAMLPDLASNMEFRSMFLDEGQIVRSIDHQNVVHVYEVGQERGILYMAMEWVEGDSLHTLIAEANKRRPIPPEVAVRLISDTAAGLHAAHELRGWDGQLREIVHCDVSPHNILIGLDGVVKLVDFGVAGAMNQIGTDDELKIRGKFGYMSPEQAQAKQLDRRSDVFSLGIVLFELTTGYRLFRGRDDRHTLELVTWGKIPRPSQVISKYPERLEGIVMKALEREIERRFQTAEELRDALETYLVEERILVPAAGVKGLLRKVLGAKIDQRRQQIRASIRALDGSHMKLSLVSDDPVLADDEAVSVSVSDADALSNPSFASQPSSSSRGLGAAFLPGDGSSGVQTLSQPSGPPPRSNKFLLIGTALGIVIAGGGFLALGLRAPEPQVKEAGPIAAGSAPKPAWPAAAPNQGAAAPQPANGLSIDSLPEDPGAGGRPGFGFVPRRPDSPKTPEQLQRDMEALRVPKSGDVAKVTLTEEDRVSELAKSVKLDDKTESSGAHAPSSGSDFDRAAAQAALGRAAGMVGMCHRPGGDSGPGKVLVTFGPNGRAQNVTVQGISGPVADCVATQFRNTKIAPFSGDPVTVGKGFVIPD
jgi:eukaryotic-like serine/threonine-protein kinase